MKRKKRSRRRGSFYEAAAIARGAGEEAWLLGALCISTSLAVLLLLALLLSWPFSLFSLLLPSADAAVESSALDSGAFF
jgi:hypothetical protein